MEFIDSTGHVFSMPSYNDKPVIYDYKENDYIFWLSNDKVSVNQYFIKPIRFIIPIEEIFDNETLIGDFYLTINIDSQFYKLVGPKTIQDKLEKVSNINETILINFDECEDTLDIDDFYIDENIEKNLIVENNNSKKYILFPFYVIGKSRVEGTYLSNIFINIGEKLINDEELLDITIKYNQYTPITVGCTFIDECEELIINGKNMGINLPKDIVKAFYDTSYESIYADEKILKDKMKELLMNYMSIKGECGNFKSVLNSLKWFGWGNKIEISKLIKTDNEFIDQYILDYFTIDNDLKSSFRYFNTTNMVSLSVNGNQETGENYLQNFDESFIGEGNPIMEDLFKKNIEIDHDGISFYAPYYRFILHELALKLDCLKYYYQNYFLPVHIKINRASINYKVYANKVKLSAIGLINNTSQPIYISNNNIIVKFPDTDELIFYKSKHFIDKKFNEFSNYNEDYKEEDLYGVNENNVFIPIKIIDMNNQFTEDNFGDYVLIGEEYQKIYKFYKIVSEGQEIDSVIETKDPKEATVFQISKDDEIFYISYDSTQENYLQRYSKISEGYFNCKLILTGTTIQQSNKGKYVYLDGEYKYKDKFYNKFIKDFSKNNTYYEDINGNYINYHGECIYVNPSDRYDIITTDLITDNNFNFYQSSSQYYVGYTLIPRLLTKINKLDNTFDWLNTQFRLSLQVNNKWYYYDFKIKIPSIYLEFGKLQYRYNISENNTMFNQLREQSDVSLKFNSFMYQPDLVSIDTLFYNKENKEMLSFIDKLLEIKNESNNDTEIEQKMLIFYSNYFRNKIKVPYNKYYFNKIHLFKLYNRDNEVIFNGVTDNDSLDTSLYDALFEDTKFKVFIHENIEYDAYLMHDSKKVTEEGKTPYWYVVFISKYPVGYYDNPEDLEIKTPEYNVPRSNYKLVYSGYNVEKFLVNRMDIVKSNGYNHFNKNDLIVTTIENNNFQFNIDLSAKWEINKIADVNKIYKVNSNSNIAIITNNEYDGYYDPGYYNVTLNYTVNGISNHEYTAIGYYMVDRDNLNIIYNDDTYISYDEPTVIDISKIISDFSILYSNENGRLRNSTDILNPSEGYYPIGIKVVNKNYFEQGSPAVYMGLKCLDVRYPETGYSGDGSLTSMNLPHIGFYYEEIDGLYEYKGRSSKKLPSGYIATGYCPSDNEYYTKYESQGKEVPEARQALNNRAYANNANHIDILNADDTLNHDMFDETCAVSNWNGEENCEIFVNNFGEDYENWRSMEDYIAINKKFRNCPSGYYISKLDGNFYTNNTLTSSPTASNLEKLNFNKRFSPAVACALRYHTKGTNPGEWHLPSYSEILFTAYNFKKYSDIFLQLAEKYPEYCKKDLLTCIGTSGLWTSTLSSNHHQVKNNYIQGPGYVFDIHPVNGTAHEISKHNTWYSIPYIFIR